jgi:antiviral helicase SLH1
MSPAIGTAETKWLEQLHAMREALAELNLPPADNTPAYGDDLDIDDDDLSGAASGEDVWDVISDEYEEEYSSDHLDENIARHAAERQFDQQWLAERCAVVAGRSSGLNGEALKQQVSAILASDSNSRFDA